MGKCENIELKTKSWGNSKHARTAAAAKNCVH